MGDERHQVILLPGGVTPAALAYSDLVRALGPDVDACPKELELYAGTEPPAGWGLETELEGIRRLPRTQDSSGFTSSGTRAAACALAFCAAQPDRLLSLALNEPAWAAARTARKRNGHTGAFFEERRVGPKRTSSAWCCRRDGFTKERSPSLKGYRP